uniref:Uncharacterized protein n=1 Tax=Physcomitrium patens TaxID=3218 RepID=A0A2K1KT96_PHYPA|nr:hypothetical protein PHYPA_003995 [Physcomitrium patens]
MECQLLCFVNFLGRSSSHLPPRQVTITEAVTQFDTRSSDSDTETDLFAVRFGDIAVEVMHSQPRPSPPLIPFLSISHTSSFSPHPIQRC